MITFAISGIIGLAAPLPAISDALDMIGPGASRLPSTDLDDLIHAVK